MNSNQPDDVAPVETTVEIEVRYAETDRMGVVHHANYLVWFELARTRLCADTEYPYARIEEMGYYLMVTGAHLSYRGGATYGDHVEVRCWLSKLGSRMVHFSYEVTRGGQRLVTGTTEHAWVDRETLRTCRMPEVLRPGFERLAGQA